MGVSFHPCLKDVLQHRLLRPLALWGQQQIDYFRNHVEGKPLLVQGLASEETTL